ncbi:MAG TPA: hypothetical protein DCK76_01335 [Desulfotomaculum sp.]|nr:MAG: hypothetical protein XD78_0956 [Desulfotomaculum sp. 46_296]HAG10054.1 hypothetical protein [Desulfotomaculum sp.]HBY04498.1 hypothetical protein [Desulfotomaculum sp.]
MDNCCAPDIPKVYKIRIDGELIGLSGIVQAFLDVRSLDLIDKEAAEKLFEIVGQRNYIPESCEREYKRALLAEYKNYITK